MGMRYPRAAAGAALVAALATGPAAAQELAVQAYYEHITYREPGVMRIAGPMVGAALVWQREGEAFWLQAQGRVSVGGLRYDGAFQDGTPVQTDSRDQVYVAEARTGRVGDMLGGRLRVYAGLGARYWDNRLQGPGSYLRRTHYIYAPVGARFDTGGPRSRFGAGAEYRFLLYGANRARLSDVDPRYSDPRFRQRQGGGVRLSLHYARSRAGHGAGSLTVEPYYEYWRIGESERELVTFDGEPRAYYVEPENRTRSIGVALGVTF
jgi:hypothetical protein